MESRESRKLAVTLEQLAARGADSAHITDAIVSTWESIDLALSPIIGRKGVAALYARSLYLIRPRHPWVSGIQGADAIIDYSQLRALMSQQGSAATAAAGGDHLQTLYELLGTLIGPSLTGQLLGAAWDNAFDRLPRRM